MSIIELPENSTQQQTDEFNHQVRQISLLVSIAGSAGLSDSVIVNDVFLEDANLEVKEMIPNWSDILIANDDNTKRLKSIVRKVTAIKLLSSAERKSITGLDDLGFTVDLIKAKDLIDQWKQEVVNSINYLRVSTTTTDTIGSGKTITNAIVVDAY